jgi:hypothetical protein
MLLVKFSKDMLWKGIIEDLFEDFLHFFFSDYVHQIDFSKPYEFLDKELQEIVPASETKNRRADLLVKVFLKNGEEKWLLIHIEVQGYVDKDFALRMYTYYYRSFDRFNKKITALAILTDENENFRLTCYEEKTWNTKIRYDFEMFKLLDYDESYFSNSDNPFASVMLAARSHLKNNSLKTDEDLLSLKVRLFRTMFEKGHDKSKIRSIANFIKIYATFKRKDFLIKLNEEISRITKNKSTMGLIEAIAQETIRVNREDAMNQGIEKGERRKTRNMIAKCLNQELSIELICNIADVSEEQFEIFKQEILIEKALKKGDNVKVIMDDLNVTEEQILMIKKDLEKFKEN